MATRKATVKVDKKTEQEQLIQGAINGNYSLLIPCKGAEFVYVRNPLTGRLLISKLMSLSLFLV